MDYPDHDVQVALLTIELHIPQAQSLKEKRGAVRSLKDSLKNRFNASVIEINHLDKWQRAGLAVCMIGGDRRKLETDVAKLKRDCEDAPRVHLVSIDEHWL